MGIFECIEMDAGYDRVSVLARGAFGTVYLGRRRTDAKDVVVKEIQLDSIGDPVATEVKVLKLVKHPNIIAFYEANVVNDTIYMASPC